MHVSDKKEILLHLLLKTKSGKMLEWLKRHAWKACKRPKRFTGSNPVLSAFKSKRKSDEGFLFSFIVCKLRNLMRVNDWELG